MRSLILLTDAQIEAAFDDACGVDDLTFTAETIAQFKAARERYARPGRVLTDTDDMLELAGVKVAKGDPSTHLLVVDFGRVRAVAWL